MEYTEKFRFDTFKNEKSALHQIYQNDDKSQIKVSNKFINLTYH